MILVLCELAAVENKQLVVDAAYQPSHTRLSPAAIRHVTSLYPIHSGKAYGVNASMEPNRPLMYMNSSPSLWLCMAPKTGCTAWQNLLLYVNENVTLQDPASVHALYGRLLNERWSSYNWRLLPELTKRDRVWIVRNPFVRFLSSYLDWRARNRANNAPFAVTLENFTSMYEREQLSVGSGFRGYIYLPSHVRPVSDVCNAGVFGTDVILRIEQMDLWYDTFMHHYGIDRFEARLKTEHGRQFYLPAVNSATLLGDKLKEVLGQAPWAGTALPTGHESSSATRLSEHYTPAIARKVFQLQRVDFESFGYPAWDGNPARFSFV